MRHVEHAVTIRHSRARDGGAPRDLDVVQSPAMQPTVMPREQVAALLRRALQDVRDPDRGRDVVDVGQEHPDRGQDQHERERDGQLRLLVDIAHWGQDHRRVRERIAQIMEDLRAAALDEHRSGLG